MRVLGIDVSQFQSTMNWNTAWNQGGRFAFIRASRTDTVPDTRLNTFAPAAKTQGFLVGVYHRALPFSNTSDSGAFRDPIVDADAFISAGGAYMGNGYMRPVLDIENGSSLRDNPVNGYNLSQWVVAFVNRVKQVKGVDPIIYCNGNFARNYLDSSVTAAAGDLWIARWNSPFPNPHTDQPQVVSGWPNIFGHWNLNGYSGTPHPDSWDFWQYSASGNGLGSTWGAASVDIDLDVWNGDNINVLKQNFITGAADIPANVSPANGATGLNPTNVSLDWNDSVGAIAYDVFLDGVKVGSDVAASQYTHGATLADGAHSWSIIAKGVLGDDDTHVTGSTWSFTTEAAPPPPPLPPGTINGALFHDLDGDAALDAGEPALSGRTVWLDADNDAILDAGETLVTTNGSGQYSFSVPAGTYTVRQSVPGGWYQTVPLNNGARTAVVTSGQTATLFAFGTAQYSSISGTVFRDKNGNGIKNSGEGGLSAWRIYIDTNSNGLFDAGETSTLTNSSGNWSLSNLKTGSYTIRVVVQSGFTLTTPSGGSFNHTLFSGTTIAGDFFGAR
jgi:GH25 family lysozyme M1 (1,4-beta-N-acetylmuramidase)